MHSANDVQFGKSRVPDLLFLQVTGDNADHFTAMSQYCIGDHAHQSNVTTPLDQAELLMHEQFTDGGCHLTIDRF